MNPLSMAMGAAQFGLGALQSVTSGVKKANRKLEQFADSYKPNTSIMDYYNKALSNYDANPYQSASYNNAIQNNQRNLATGLSASSDRRGGLANIGALVQGTNNADANAAQRAEANQRASLNVLGNATNMKAREDFKPFEMKYNLLAAKAGAKARQKQNGTQNMFGGIGSMIGGGLGAGNDATSESKPWWKK